MRVPDGLFKNSQLRHAYDKLEEADFFQDVLNSLCYQRDLIPVSTLLVGSENGEFKSYPDRFTLEEQIAFMLSAFVNACYAAVEHVKRESRLHCMAKDFCARHPFFYGSGSTGGIRTVTTHFRPLFPVEVEGIKHVSPGPLDHLGGEELDEMGWGISDEPPSPPPPHELPPQIRKQFYLSSESPQDPLPLICTRHHLELHHFLDSCREALGEARISGS